MLPPIRTVLGTVLASLSLAALPVLAEAPANSETEGRVLLAPLNLGVEITPELEPGIEPVWQALMHHFDTNSPRAASLHPESASALWANALASLDESKRSDVYAVYGAFARTVSEQVEFETLLVPILVPRLASLRGTHAHWDGVRRRATVDDALRASVEGLSGFELEVRGKIGAASLHVVALDADGAVVSEGKGGIALLHEIHKKGARLQTALRSDAFANEKRLREGVEQALSVGFPASVGP